jgi:hypothetical protein
LKGRGFQPRRNLRLRKTTVALQAAEKVELRAAAPEGAIDNSGAYVMREGIT